MSITFGRPREEQRSRLDDPQMFEDSIVRSFANSIAHSIIESILYPQDQDNWREEMYEPDPMERLKQCIVLGQQILIRGVTGVGKTNVIACLFEIALERGWSVACNVRGFGAGELITSFLALKLWMAKPGPKLFAFDDATLYYSGRQSMKKSHQVFRPLHVLTSKQDVCFIWVEHMEKMIDVDARRFSNWILEKPYQQLGDDTDNLDGTVKLWVKRVLWAWRRGELGEMIRWWTNCLPQSKVTYDRHVFGIWDEEGMEEVIGETETGADLALVKSEKGETMHAYVIRRSKPMGEEFASVLEMTLQGMSQVDIAEKLWGNVNLQGKVSGKLKDITEKNIGYWFEDWWREQRGLAYVPDNEKNTPRSDECINGTFYTLKSKWSKLRMHTFYPEEEFAPELKAAREAHSNVIILALGNVLLDKYVEVQVDARKTPERIRVKC